MKERIKKWFYKSFGKLENPGELDGILITVIALLIIMFFIAIKILVQNGGSI